MTAPPFEALLYLAANPDLVEAGVDPTDHYERWGRNENRPLRPPSFLSAAQEEAVRRAFDAEYYAYEYPDIARACGDLFWHFLTIGWREGRNPSGAFDTAEYLRLHRDVRDAGMNPLVHWVIYGRATGRLLGRAPDSPQRAIEAAQAPSARVAGRAPASVPLLPREVLAARLREAASRGGRALAVSVSHDDYAVVSGGVQNVVGDEARAIAEAGGTYLHLRAVQALPMLAPPDRPVAYALRVNGEAIGAASGADIAAALREAGRLFPARGLMLHHLLGTKPEEVAAIADALAPARTWFVLHDYFTLCVNPMLMRNDFAYCGAPPAESGSCFVCCYGQDRRDHLARMTRFLGDVRPDMVAFSCAAASLWRARELVPGLDLREAVPARLEAGAPVALPERVRSGEAPLRVAFLGAPTHAKGWRVFAELSEAERARGRVAFFHFGVPDKGRPDMTTVEVRVTPDARMAMVEALRAHAIDVVVHWSLCAETFGFSALEALAAGAFVVARDGPGNIPALLRPHIPDQACLVKDEAALRALFASGDIFEYAARSGRRRFDLVTLAPLAAMLLGEEVSAHG